MDLNNSFCLRSNLCNDNILFLPKGQVCQESENGYGF